jgi:hypothetical protein
MKLYILKELVRRGGMSISICNLMGQKNKCIHSVKGGKLQREQKSCPQTLKEKVVEGKKKWSPIQEEKIVGHQKKTKRPLSAKEMKLEGKI